MNQILIGRSILIFDWKRPQTSPNVPNNVPRLELGTREALISKARFLLADVWISILPITFRHVAHVTHVSRLLVHSVYETSSVCHVAKLYFDRTVQVARIF